MNEIPNDITVEASTIPPCPNCQGVDWQVYQKITRDSKLIRVDGLRDLVVEKPDEGSSGQALKIECLGCGAEFLPQADVKTSEELNRQEQIEAWSLDTGLYDWPRVVVNESQYE